MPALTPTSRARRRRLSSDVSQAPRSSVTTSAVRNTLAIAIDWGKAKLDEGAWVLGMCAAKVRKRLHPCAENGYELRAVYKQRYRLVPVSVISTHAEKLKFGRPGDKPNAALLPNF